MDVDPRFFAPVRGRLAALEREDDGLEAEPVEAGSIRPRSSVLKNGRDIIHMDGVETTLPDGDVVSAFPPVAGG